MGRVQGGARAAFATPSWGPARIHSLYYCIAKSKNTLWRPATHSILGAISFKNIHHRKTNESFTLTLKKLFR